MTGSQPVIPAPSAPATMLLVPAQGVRCVSTVARPFICTSTSAEQQPTDCHQLGIEVELCWRVLLDGSNI